MACIPCGNRGRRPVAGRRTPRRAKASDTVTAAATSAGKWSTTCDNPGEPVRSLIKAQRAARACGGRVVPA